ncbi:FAD binding domain-containing protein [Porcincola sp. LCP21S3_C12]|uniref:FAD binding domain-containing protein n=1 Tax=Porcincola sp. LCP21S3_C12 TaxID=3438798 RepID=UPI003F99F1FE
MYDIENYYEAKSVEDAVAHLAADEKAEVIAGGTDVLVKLRSGKDAGCDLVSIHEIPELKGVDRLTDGTIVIGPATCFTDITNDPIIRESFPYLGEAVDTVGGPQIRNMGTIGGNLCNGATSADSGATMQTLDATLVLQGPEGSREVPVTEFYTGPGKTVRRRDEVLIAILVKPEDYVGYSGCYIKYGKRRSMEIATLGCCVRVKLEAAGAEQAEAEETDGIQGSSATRREDAAGSAVLPGAGFRLADVRIGYGVAAPTPIRCRKTEQMLKGMAADDPAIYEIIATHVEEEVHPRSSWRASKEFRVQLIREMAKRALEQAILRGIGKGTPGAGDFPPVEFGEEQTMDETKTQGTADAAGTADDGEDVSCGKGGENHA